MTQDEKIKSYEPMFWIVAMTTILYVVLFFFLVVHDDPAKTFKERALEAAARQEQMTDDSKPSTTKKQQIKQLMTNPQYIFLLVVTLLVGYGRQVFSIYRAKFVEASILNTFDGDRKSFVSITVLTGIVFEILVFFYGKFFLKRMGNYWLMVASLITMLIRLWAYVFVPENEHLWVWFLICVELLKGMSFSTLQIAAVQMSADIAGPDLQATAQGIFTAFNNGFAGVLGAVGSGIILKWPGVARAEKTTGPEMGLKATFLFSAILTTVALGIVMMWPVISRLVNRFRR